MSVINILVYYITSGLKIEGLCEELQKKSRSFLRLNGFYEAD